MLQNLDWHYRVSFDKEYVKEQTAKQIRLQRISYNSPEHYSLYIAFENYALSGPKGKEDPNLKPQLEEVNESEKTTK